MRIGTFNGGDEKMEDRPANPPSTPLQADQGEQDSEPSNRRQLPAILTDPIKRWMAERSIDVPQ